jgi:hypothetical protein
VNANHVRHVLTLPMMSAFADWVVQGIQPTRYYIGPWMFGRACEWCARERLGVCTVDFIRDAKNRIHVLVFCTKHRSHHRAPIGSNHYRVPGLCPLCVKYALGGPRVQRASVRRYQRVVRAMYVESLRVELVQFPTAVVTLVQIYLSAELDVQKSGVLEPRPRGCNDGVNPPTCTGWGSVGEVRGCHSRKRPLSGC